MDESELIICVNSHPLLQKKGEEKYFTSCLTFSLRCCELNCIPMHTPTVPFHITVFIIFANARLNDSKRVVQITLKRY